MENDFFKSFQTHFNYVKCMSEITNGLEICCNKNIKVKNPCLSQDVNFIKKINLIKPLKKTIDLEYDVVNDLKELALPGGFWIPTKAYYLLFHMSCIISVLRNGDINCLNPEHIKVHNNLKTELINNKLKFNYDKFNKVYSYQEILDLERESGYNLKNNFDNEKMINFILNKIINYKKEFIKRTKNVKDFRSKKGKEEIRKIKNMKFTLIEFIYFYRIKTNYSDIDFLDNDIELEDLYNFYLNYYNLTNNIYLALKECLNELHYKKCKNINLI